MAYPKDLATVITVVRDHIDEPSAGYWSDAELTRYINKAKDDLWREIAKVRPDFFESSANLSITSGTNPPVFALASDFYRLKTIRITTSGSEQILFRAVDRADPAFIYGLRSDVTISNPVEFMFDILSTLGTMGSTPAAPASQIYLSPIPRQAYTARYEYHALVIDLTANTENFGVLNPFVGYIEAKATQYAFMKGPSGDWKSWEDDCKRMLPAILSSAQTRQMHSPEYVQGFMEDY